jgi:hypothetical protein
MAGRCMEMASSQSLSSSAGHVDLGRERIGTFGDKLTISYCNPVNSEGKRLKLSAPQAVSGGVVQLLQKEHTRWGSMRSLFFAYYMKSTSSP